MAEEQKEQPVDLQKLLDAEKKRSEDYLTRLKYLQADFEAQIQVCALACSATFSTYRKILNGTACEYSIAV